jgi:hypothetical protein
MPSPYSKTYLSPTLWSRVFLKKLTVRSANQEIPVLHGFRRFIALFTAARLQSLSRIRRFQSPHPNSTSLRSMLVLSFLVCLGLPEWSLPFKLFTQHFETIFYFSHTHSIPHPSHPSWFRHSVFGKKYKLWSFSLCTFLKPQVTSSLLGPNIVLSNLGGWRRQHVSP